MNYRVHMDIARLLKAIVWGTFAFCVCRIGYNVWKYGGGRKTAIESDGIEDDDDE